MPPLHALTAPAALAASALALSATASPAAAETAPTRAGFGCDVARPAVAHAAGGARLRRQPRGAPIPCASVAGPSQESASIGLGRSGAVFYAPINANRARPPDNVLQGPEQVARSRDRGARWRTLGSGGPTTGGLVPPWMSVDPRTSRIWFATTLPSLCGARISWSDDDGASWRTNPSVGCPAQGANKLLEGPPPAGGPRPVGYPHVVYYCANGEDRGASPVFCYRSLDGGRSFAAVGSPDPPLPAGCAERHPARTGVVGPDGVLYFPTSVCGVLGVTVSRDGGLTWTPRTIVRTRIDDTYIASMAVDRAGNLFLAWIGRGGLPQLTISRDRGASWSRPARVVAPGVRAVRRVAITARSRGQVALAYLGSADRSSFDGYITASADALARRAVFWSAAVSGPGAPLVTGSDDETYGNRLFYGTAAIAADGTVWAGFHCARTPSCPGRRLGIVGRLRPHSTRHRPRPDRQER